MKALATSGCKVAAGEPGTLSYDWHHSAENGSIVLIEAYADSSAHFSHMQADGHSEFMGSLMALIDSIEFSSSGNRPRSTPKPSRPSRERSSTQRSRASSPGVSGRSAQAHAGTGADDGPLREARDDGD